MTLTLSPETEQALRDEAERENKPPEQVAMEAMIAGLRGRRIPQSLDELPRQPLSPGKTLKDVLDENPWPHDEPDLSDDEWNRVLEELS